MLARGCVILSLCLLMVAGLSHAQECSHLWTGQLDTDPLHSKGVSGDTAAAYGLFAFKGDPDLKLVLKGKFPRARFMSIETYETRFQHRIDTRLDFEIEPDTGSLNPFHEGVALDVENRNYTLEMLPSSLADSHPNTLKLPESNKIHSFFYRIYAPHEGITVTAADLPRVFAYDAITNRPRECPVAHELPFYLNFPQFLTWWVRNKNEILFKEADFNIGTNKAIPSYLYAIDKLVLSELIVTRFKAPSFFNSQSGKGIFNNRDNQTRYWSLCFQNFPHNETLACVPDFAALPDSDGVITVVFGGNKEVETAARNRGFNFVPDRRKSNQVMVGMVYRNVLPLEDFRRTEMYQGDYRPRAFACTSAEFLDGTCGH